MTSIRKRCPRHSPNKAFPNLMLPAVVQHQRRAYRGGKDTKSARGQLQSAKTSPRPPRPDFPVQHHRCISTINGIITSTTREAHAECQLDSRQPRVNQGKKDEEVFLYVVIAYGTCLKYNMSCSLQVVPDIETKAGFFTIDRHQFESRLRAIGHPFLRRCAGRARLL